MQNVICRSSLFQSPSLNNRTYPSSNFQLCINHNLSNNDLLLIQVDYNLGFLWLVLMMAGFQILETRKQNDQDPNGWIYETVFVGSPKQSTRY